MKTPQLALVVPAHNEQEVIVDSCQKLQNLLDHLAQKNLISPDSYILVVEDGSRDNTWTLLQDCVKQFSRLKALRFSRNFGHQNALLAGLEYVSGRCDVNLCLDADLQHDISVIEEFLNHYHNGCEIVYGVKQERKHDSFSKRFFAESYYKLLALFGVKVIHNHSDFRLMSNRATEELLKFKERNLYLRGIVPLLGFKTAKVMFNLQERKGGVSKYNLRRTLSLALDGVTSFTTTPLRFVSLLGLFAIALSIIYSVVTVLAYFHGTVTGWPSIIISVLFIGGVQLLSLGVIGEYIGKIYFEVKQRPLYIVEDVLENGD